MENSVLGNALEGVPEESEEEEQPNNANLESADNLDGWYSYFRFSSFLSWQIFHFFLLRNLKCIAGFLYQFIYPNFPIQFCFFIFILYV